VKHKSINWIFWLWLLAVVSFSTAGVVILTAYATRMSLQSGATYVELPEGKTEKHFFKTLSHIPNFLHEVVVESLGLVRDEPTWLLVDRASHESLEWRRQFPDSEDPGYLLLAGVDPVKRTSTTRLVRISDGKLLHRWAPDWDSIAAQSKDFEGSPRNQRAFHPLLLSDGSIIANTLNLAFRLAPCTGKPTWILNEKLHHSVELANDGTSVWTAGYSKEGFPDSVWLRDAFDDNSIVRLSLDGKRLENRSFIKILRDNGLEAMVVGTGGFSFNPDPVHLNQITEAKSSGKFWQAGDLLISARHLSSVFLYRPSTDKIIWHKQGPWLNQHSSYFLGDHQISVLSNHVISSIPAEQMYISNTGINRVMTYDFETDNVSEPFADMLKQNRPRTTTEGRAQLLNDGGLFFEDSNNGRILRFSKDRLMWSYVNDYDATRIGVLSWSRYLTAEEAAPALSSLSASPCE
jgi:hypothetical protein